MLYTGILCQKIKHRENINIKTFIPVNTLPLDPEIHHLNEINLYQRSLTLESKYKFRHLLSKQFY